MLLIILTILCACFFVYFIGTTIVADKKNEETTMGGRIDYASVSE